MEVLVTGPDGVLGSNLVRILLDRNYKVSVFLFPESKSPTLDGLPIQKYLGNILNPEDLDLAVAGKDVVIHCAASTSVYPAKDAFVNKVNIEGSSNIVDVCLKHHVKRLIYVGTANSFGNGISMENPGTELNPYTALKYGLDYMDSKRKAQELVLHAVNTRSLPAIIVNPTFMIGPFDSKPSSGAMILAVYKGKVPGYTSGGKNYIAVKDAATAIANAITMGKIGECYILGNENLSYKESFKMIAETIGAKVPSKYMPDWLVTSYGSLNSFLARVFKFQPSVTKELAQISCENHYYSSEKAQKDLMLPQTPVRDAVKDCFEWFKENGYLNK